MLGRQAFPFEMFPFQGTFVHFRGGSSHIYTSNQGFWPQISCHAKERYEQLWPETSPTKSTPANATSRSIFWVNIGVSQNRGTPKWMVKIMENPIKMGWFGRCSPYFWFNTHIWVTRPWRSVDRAGPRRPLGWFDKNQIMSGWYCGGFGNLAVTGWYGSFLPLFTTVFYYIQVRWLALDFWTINSIT